MTHNYYWKCPKCGRINDEEDWSDHSSSVYETECCNCGYKVNVEVEMYPQLWFKSAEDGTDIKGMEEWELKHIEVKE